MPARASLRVWMSRGSLPIVAVCFAGCGGGGGGGFFGNVDASTSGDGSVDGGTGGAPPSFVILFNFPPDATLVAAHLLQGAGRRVVFGTSGPCEIARITNNPETIVSAGTITITGTTSPMTLTPSGSKPAVAYNVSPPPSYPLFAQGTTITIAAQGSADYPAFSGTLTAPASGSLGVSGPASVSRAAGARVTWTAGAGPGLVVTLAATNAGNTLPQEQISCAVPDSGSFTVPAAALAMLSGGLDQSSFSVQREDSTVVGTTELVAATIDGTTEVPLTP